MEEKIESEHSYSGESSSSSDTSSGSTEGDDDIMEPVRILGHTFELPQELCEDYSVFKEFFSMRTWDALEDKHKQELCKYLPKFTENEEEEKEKTIKMLFNHEPFHFTSPLDDFFNNLRQGNYRPDIAKMRKFLMKARAKQQKHKMKSYYAKLLPEVLISRERLLAAAKAAPPGPIPRLPLVPRKSVKDNLKPLYLRAKQRYFEELSAIRSEVGGDESEDENYPEGPPEQSVRKRKQTNPGQSTDGNVSGTLGGSDQSSLTSLECLKNVLAAHRIRRQHRENHPELITAGITLEDIKQRVSVMNGAKKLMFGGPKTGSPIQKLRRGPKKDSQRAAKQEKISRRGKEEYDCVENKPLLPNIKIKCEQEECDSESSSFVDPVTSPRSVNKMDHIEIKQEMDSKYINNVTNDSDLDCTVIKQEPLDNHIQMQNCKVNQAVPIKLEDLDGIDMMALPIEIADDSGEVVQEVRGSQIESDVDTKNVETDSLLTETTHACFLSLVRALFPARTAHRASKKQLHARCAAVMRSPIAPLNTWYNLSDDWCAELDSALDFLAGERGQNPDDFVPYLQYLPESQMYQWIGAGRDCDANLSRLCERWLRASEPTPPASEPPPSRYPTSWSVRPATDTELVEFRAQERRRFSAAAKPFTYVQHGYRAAVGPALGGGGAARGAGGAVLLAPRPRHAALPALVRDALARLPNGEGTRHNVLTLLRMSQWIAPCSDQTLLGAVSSVLDKLLSAKRDPVVKYDQRTAVWTYLHRHRSEEDWLKLTSGRGRKNPPLSVPALPPPTTSLPPPPLVKTSSTAVTAKELSHQTPHPMELDIGSIEEVGENASDSDVDVEDSSAPSSMQHLSSAQLLMQATQATQAKQITLPIKQKGKLVPNPTPKPKTTIQLKSPLQQKTIVQQKPPVQQKTIIQQKTIMLPKQTGAKTKPVLMTQSAKQANMLAQAVRQSNVQVKPQAVIQQVKPAAIQSPKQIVAQTKSVVPTVKQTNVIAQVKTNIMKSVSAKTQPISSVQSPKATPLAKIVVNQSGSIASQLSTAAQLSKSLPAVVATPTKSPLIKQRPLQKVEVTHVPVSATSVPNLTISQPPGLVPTSTAAIQIQNKVTPGTRSLLIRPHSVQTTVTSIVGTPTATQSTTAPRRGVVRVLSPATPASGKSLISPRALMQQGVTTATATMTTAKKRPTIATTTLVTTTAQSSGCVTAVVSSAGSAPRTVQLGAGRAVQLAPRALLSAVRLPRAPAPRPAAPRPAAPRPAAPRPAAPPAPHVPVSTVQLAGQTVQIAGQTVQLAGQSVQLTGHTVKLPNGQSVHVAGQGVLPPHTVQLANGQTVHLGGGGLQLSGQSVQVASGQTVQLGSQTVQLGGQTVQLAGQTVQLPSGQTLQLPSGQTVQLSSGQALQLASGQAVQIANSIPKSSAQVVRAQTPTDKPSTGQPIVAKLLTNAQGQMISLEGMVGGARTLQVSGVRPRAGVRVLSPGTRLARPLLLTSTKPLHNIILQQSESSALRVTSSGAASTSQTLVLGNIGSQSGTTSTSSAPLLKLQQVNPIHQVKLAQGIKIQQATSGTTTTTSSGVRSVLMDGQQLKLVGGRHVLARILRPAHPPP